MLNNHQWKEVENCKQNRVEDTEGDCCNSCSIVHVCLGEDLAQHRTMLKKLEWCIVADFGSNRRCPVCLELRTDGHKKDCELASLLRSGENDTK
jgi:hypothetical protein